MKILIIGAAGMIGTRLAKSIIKNKTNKTKHDITLFDVIAPKLDENDGPCRIKIGDISDSSVAAELINEMPDII